MIQASDDKGEGKSGKSQRQRLLEDLYKKYCFGGTGPKSDGQVCEPCKFSNSNGPNHNFEVLLLCGPKTIHNNHVISCC